MADLLSGVLLPSSVLSTTWFQALAAFVALNTVIYVGLTLAKLTRWPRQLDSVQARRLHARLNPGPDTDAHPTSDS
jgi:hypothetical protein